MGRIVLVALVLAAGALAQTPTGGLTGTIADITGARIGGAKIVIPGLTPRTAATNEQGQFLIAGLEPALYQLTVTCAGFVPKQISGRVDGNQTTALGEIRMQVAGNVGDCPQWEQPRPTVVVRKREHGRHGIVIAGTVRDWGKSLIAGATIRVRSTAEPDSPTVVNTDKDGRFEITGLKPGTYVMSVESGTFDPVMILSIIVREGFEARVDDIVMGTRQQLCL